MDVKHHGRRGRTAELGRGAWAVIPYPTLPPSLISLVVSVDAKYHGRRKRRTAELRSCVKREVGQGSRSLSHSFPVPNKPLWFLWTQSTMREENLVVVSTGIIRHWPLGLPHPTHPALGHRQQRLYSYKACVAMDTVFAANSEIKVPCTELLLEEVPFKAWSGSDQNYLPPLCSSASSSAGNTSSEFCQSGSFNFVAKFPKLFRHNQQAGDLISARNTFFKNKFACVLKLHRMCSVLFCLEREREREREYFINIRPWPFLNGRRYMFKAFVSNISKTSQRERERENSKTLFYKDYSLGSVKKLSNN